MVVSGTAHEISKSVTWGGKNPVVEIAFSASENSRIHSQFVRRLENLGSDAVSGTGSKVLCGRSNNGDSIFEYSGTNHHIHCSSWIGSLYHWPIRLV